MATSHKLPVHFASAPRTCIAYQGAPFNCVSPIRQRGVFVLDLYPRRSYSLHQSIADCRQMTLHHIFETAFGFCGIAWNERGISRFMLPMSASEAAEERMMGRLSVSGAAQPSGFALEAVAAAQRYFAGSHEDFSAYPVDLDGIDAFRRAIYRTARQLGYGRTTTYGGLAADAGFPNATRETGVALSRNPVPLIIPCHRILAAGGKLGGFSAPGGTATKQKMLALEKAASPNAPPAQASFAF